MKTSITIDPSLWESVKSAAESWAARESLPTRGMTSKWIAKQLKEAVKRELEVGKSATGGGSNA